jgi:hypothetical protein
MPTPRVGGVMGSTSPLSAIGRLHNKTGAQQPRLSRILVPEARNTETRVGFQGASHLSLWLHFPEELAERASKQSPAADRRV